MFRRVLVLAFSASLVLQGIAQDTLRISVHGADSLLITRNLDLLAQHYEIDKAEAARMQAKLFNNPSLYTEWSVRPDKGAFFDIGPSGERIFSISELVRIAGQRGLGIRVAEAEKKMSADQYAEMASSLRYQLHADLYQQFYLRRAINTIGSQLDLLKGVVDAYATQVGKGNVSMKEATRLKSSYFGLNDQRVQIEKQSAELQQELRTLLADDRYISVVPTPGEIVPIRPLPLDTTQLVSAALTNRAAVAAAQDALDANEMNLKLQHRSTVPDVAFGGVYDANGNYLPRYTALSAGLSLPIFDRNQARISAARASLEQSKAGLSSTRRNVRQQVQHAVADLKLLQAQYTDTGDRFDDQLDELSESLIGNYLKSNISLLEFTDLFESYTGSIIRMNSLKAELQTAYEELEFSTGQRLFTR